MSNTDLKGWVYLIVNDQQRPEAFRVKVGITDRDPVERAGELISTGTNGTFVVIYQAWVAKPRLVEKSVHRRLAAFNRGGEWFEVCPDHAREEIVRASGGVHYEETTPRWHPSQPAPLEWTKTVLREARLAAEQKAKRQREAEEQARRLAEEQRIREAEAAEERRRKAELEEHRRLAEERARVAQETSRKRAVAAEAENRKRREALIAEQRRQRVRKAIRTGAPFLAIGLLLAAVAYALTRPVTLQEYEDRRTAVQSLVAKVERLRSEIEADEQRLANSEADIKSSPGEQQGLVRMMDEKVASIAGWSQELRAAQEDLAEFERSKREPSFQPTAPLRQYWLDKNEKNRRSLTASVESLKNSIQSAELAVAEMKSRLRQIPDELSKSRAAVPSLKSAIATARRDLLQAEAALTIARLRLSQAERSHWRSDSGTP